MRGRRGGCVCLDASAQGRGELRNHAVVSEGGDAGSGSGEGRASRAQGGKGRRRRSLVEVKKRGSAFENQELDDEGLEGTDVQHHLPCSITPSFGKVKSEVSGAATNSIAMSTTDLGACSESLRIVT